MSKTYKILAEKYEQVLEADQEPVMTVNKSGEFFQKEWRLNGKLHRLDGPAVVQSDGSEFWFHNGSLHRLDGPAVVQSDGTTAWKRHGKFHRLDGPAIEWANGSMTWIINGKYYSEDAFNKEIWNRNPTRRDILKNASRETGIEVDI